MRKLALSVLLSILAGCGSEPAAAPAERVSEAWVTLPAASGRPGAAYFTLWGGEGGDTLLAIDSPDAERVELHETMDDNGRMTMRAFEAVEIAPEETVRFEPGGRHAMLFGIDENIEAGMPIRLNFRFDSGRDMQLEAQTVGPGAESPYAAQK